MKLLRALLLLLTIAAAVAINKFSSDALVYISGMLAIVYMIDILSHNKDIFKDNLSKILSKGNLHVTTAGKIAGDASILFALIFLIYKISLN